MTVGATISTTRKHVRRAVDAADKLFGRVSWGTYNGHHPSRDLAGDAMVPDWGTGAGRSYGAKLADWLWAHRLRLGVWYVIWNGRIISRTHPRRGWTTYRPTADAIRRSPASAYHRNHVHVSFYPSVPAAVVATVKAAVGMYPKPRTRVAYVDRLRPGQQNSDSVYWVQKALGVKATGDYDPATVAAVKRFQKSLGDHVDGDLGPLQTRALFRRHPKLGVRVADRS